MRDKKTCDFLITGFSKELRDICTQHTRNTLKYRGNARYIEDLIRKDLGL